MSNIKVLIVDDNPDQKNLFESAHPHLDIDINFIGDGLQAISYLEEQEVDAVLIDLAMPYFDGISCVKEIRQNEKLHLNRPPTRLAFYTAHQIDDVVERVQKEFNVETVFQKPIEPFELVEKVKEWLKH